MKKMIMNNVEDLKNARDFQRLKYKKLKRFAGMQLHQCNCKNGISYYSVRKDGNSPFKYVGNDNKSIVKSIKEERFLALSLQTIENNIEIAERFLNSYKGTSIDEINNMLPKSYRLSAINNCYQSDFAKEWKEKAEAHKSKFPIIHPERLTQPTIDGKMVRSKSEAMIYNQLTVDGYTFVYELPIEVNGRILYPDFAILSEIDYKTVILIEHQGMMDDFQYRTNAENREYIYWKNDYLPGRDVFFTYDDMHGRLDIGPVMDILKTKVRPGKVNLR